MRKAFLKSNNKVLFRIIVCAVVLMVGFIGMNGLANMKKRPSELRFSEPSLRVEALPATAENVTVSIKGFGEVKTLNVVSITPEVSGTIIDIHPKLEAGEVISKGDMIFKIDPRNYQASLQEAGATVRQLENGILMLKRQLEIDKDRLTSLRRNRDIAREQHERVRKLFDEDRVGTLSGVDQAEQSLISVSDQATQMARTVELYPIQIRESENSLESARARLSTAKLNLERCEVRAPFTGRVKSVSLEKGQYVSPGKEVVTLADDSLLEIEVSIDSRDAEKWLRFNEKTVSGTNAWFDGLEKVDCSVRWTEASSDTVWKGTLNRVVAFDAKTRTLTVAIRITAEDALSQNGNALPLVEGMFCSVEIPGKIMTNVIKIPRWAVSYENTVYMSIDSRLKTVPVEVAKLEGDNAFISGGIHPGDMVVTTRLVNPLENSLLIIQ